jgi:hypothetical protein
MLRIGRRVSLWMSDGMALHVGPAVGTEILFDEDEQFRRVSRDPA